MSRATKAEVSASKSRLTDAEIQLVKEAYAITRRQRAEAARNDCQGERVTAEVAKKSPSPFDMIDDAAGRVGSVAGRVAALAERLAGPVPADGCGAKVSERSGVLGATADRAENIFYAVAAMHAALDRIEQQLP